jgi:chromosome segregation ATPase
MATKIRDQVDAIADEVDRAHAEVEACQERVQEIGARMGKLGGQRGLKDNERAKLEAKRTELLTASARGDGATDALVPVRAGLLALSHEIQELDEMHQSLRPEALSAQAALVAAETAERLALAELALSEAAELRQSLNNAGAEYERRWRLLRVKYEEIKRLKGSCPDDLDQARTELRDHYQTWYESSGMHPRMPVVGQRRDK